MRIPEGLDDALGDALAQPRLLLANLAAGPDTGVDIHPQLDWIRRLVAEACTEASGRDGPGALARRFAQCFHADNPGRFNTAGGVTPSGGAAG
jgi:hypothetical protein